MTYEKPEVSDFGPIAENTYLIDDDYDGGPSGDVVDTITV